MQETLRIIARYILWLASIPQAQPIKVHSSVSEFSVAIRTMNYD